MWNRHNQDGLARTGSLHLSHGDVPTPAFMPVGTQASVKTVTPDELKAIGYQLILGNTYHLNLRPGIALIQEFGGLHRFMNWDRGILTDSGGFQVFSLAPLRKITSEGVIFQSHIDGSTHLLTPENVIDKQLAMGVDIAMVLDECPPFPAERSYVETSMQVTLDWAKRSRTYHPKGSSGPKLFGIVQGGMHADLRKQCVEQLIDLDFEGYAMGGLSVGENKALMYEMFSLVADILPQDSPRYLMGIGTPEDLLEGVACGVDMFDCVLPSRNARNGTLFTWQGKVIIKNQRWEKVQDPIDPTCTCYTCKNFSAGYLRHLFRSREILSLRLNTLHNLHFFYQLMHQARQAISEQRFGLFKEKCLEAWSQT